MDQQSEEAKKQAHLVRTYHTNALILVTSRMLGAFEELKNQWSDPITGANPIQDLLDRYAPEPPAIPDAERANLWLKLLDDMIIKPGIACACIQRAMGGHSDTIWDAMIDVRKNFKDWDNMKEDYKSNDSLKDYISIVAMKWEEELNKQSVRIMHRGVAYMIEKKMTELLDLIMTGNDGRETIDLSRTNYHDIPLYKELAALAQYLR